MIFVVCPAKTETGGTEALHQLVDMLTKLGAAVRMLYIGGEPVVPEKFRHYAIPIRTNEAIDEKENMVIFPEVYTQLAANIRQASVGIWWLSVDNCHDDNALKLKATHFYQSEYARKWLFKNGIRGKHLGDYISSTFFVLYNPLAKENVVVFNPAKGWVNTKDLMNRMPDVTFVPLTGTSEELRAKMHRAKVYIDLGNHPGKDRIPREAALCGCIVITNREGAAQNETDIPLLFWYKSDSLTDTEHAVRRAFENYYRDIHEQDDYRQSIANEEQQFREDCQRLIRNLEIDNNTK